MVLKMINRTKIMNERNETEIKITKICIPRVETYITRQKIYNIFIKLNIGKIERITENILKINEKYKRIILKIRWNNTEMANLIKRRLYGNLPVNIVYELPWFWKLVLAK